MKKPKQNQAPDVTVSEISAAQAQGVVGLCFARAMQSQKRKESQLNALGVPFSR